MTQKTRDGMGVPIVNIMIWWDPCVGPLFMESISSVFVFTLEGLEQVRTMIIILSGVYENPRRCGTNVTARKLHGIPAAM